MKPIPIDMDNLWADGDKSGAHFIDDTPTRAMGPMGAMQQVGHQVDVRYGRYGSTRVLRDDVHDRQPTEVLPLGTVGISPGGMAFEGLRQYMRPSTIPTHRMYGGMLVSQQVSGRTHF